MKGIYQILLDLFKHYLELFSSPFFPVHLLAITRVAIQEVMGRCWTHISPSRLTRAAFDLFCFIRFKFICFIGIINLINK